MNALIEAALRPLFTLWSYPLSTLEAAAFLLTLFSVWLNVKEKIAAWPVGNIGVGLYAVLFFQSKLYGDAALQLFFIVLGCWGWWQWWRKTALSRLQVSTLNTTQWRVSVLAALIAYPLLGMFLKKFTDTDVPFWDAFPTTVGIVAQILLARKKIENWSFWIAANLVSVALFLYKNLYLTALLYSLFVLLAVQGWRAWQAKLAAQTKPQVMR